MDDAMIRFTVSIAAFLFFASSGDSAIWVGLGLRETGGTLTTIVSPSSEGMSISLKLR